MKTLCLGLVAFAALGLSGCQTGEIPNPNDPADMGSISPDTLRRNLSAVTDGLATRRANQELNDTQYRSLVTKAARELLDGVDASTIKPAQAWQYGEVLRDAQLWSDAEPVLELALRYAKDTKNEDRRVNDTLRLAVVRAHLGRYAEAIRTARTCFDTPADQGAPILMAVLLELAPIVRGHKVDLQYAKLLEDAIPIHARTKVDPNTQAGRDFIFARPFHIRNAWNLVIQLYRGVHREDLAVLAEKKKEEMSSSFGANRVRV